MKTFPLPFLTVAQAAAKQFALVEALTRHFNGAAFLSGGDLGLVSGLGRPRDTARAEETLADFFGQEDAALLRGAGTGAIRAALAACFAPGDKVFVHTSPLYPTTRISFEELGLGKAEGDFNDLAGAQAAYRGSSAGGALVQLARQRPEDSYDYEKIIKALKEGSSKPLITDDNYGVMKVERIGCEAGADLSCFSLFKLLGPPGIGCVTGKKIWVEKIRKTHYSGGVQVQGSEALEALRGLVYAPVALALQAQVCSETAERLGRGEVPGVKEAVVVNAQSRVILVELEEPRAREALVKAETLGAAPYPVGSESRYEVAPLFYRVSGTFLESDPTLADRMIRINPMRSGADTIIRILSRALEA
ncbi:MAG: aminotransferase class I/II-fold pyridoxal phosphate-dependent enzyme [Spirochaetales bacterium]|jgi:hypothetical protein|nr:aminotransferase class I/II-fold pyridoxal phosphate-dependent enzyme [Spirochaetales bacterium]